MPISLLNKLSIKLIVILFFLLISLLAFSISILLKISSEYKAIEHNWMPSVKVTKDIRDSLIYLKYSQDLYLTTHDKKYVRLIEYRKNRISKLLMDYNNLISSENERVIHDRLNRFYRDFIRCEIDLTEHCYEKGINIDDLSFYKALNETKELLKINENQMGHQLSSSNSMIYRYKNILATSVFSVLALLILIFAFIVKEKFKEKTTIPHRILSGLNNSFKLVYQPIVDINSNQIVGVEVLSRFEDKYGKISPDVFIPIIRYLGVSWDFTKRVIELSVSDFNMIRDISPTFKISINIFPTDLEQNILDVLDLHISDNYSVVFEITEFEGCDNEKVQENIKRLNELGYTFSIDDFGTGYSNFNTLKDFDISALKIDRSLLFDIEDEPVKIVLLKNICEMAKTLSLNVIAEGIENVSQHSIISDAGVKYAQGWLYGKPVDILFLSEILVRDNSINRLNMLKEC